MHVMRAPAVVLLYWFLMLHSLTLVAICSNSERQVVPNPLTKSKWCSTTSWMERAIFGSLGPIWSNGSPGSLVCDKLNGLIHQFSMEH